MTLMRVFIFGLLILFGNIDAAEDNGQADCSKNFCVSGTAMREELSANDNFLQVTGTGENATISLPHGIPPDTERFIHFYTRTHEDPTLRALTGQLNNISDMLEGYRKTPDRIETRMMNMLFQQSDVTDQSPREDVVPMGFSGTIEFESQPPNASEFDVVMTMAPDSASVIPDVTMIIHINRDDGESSMSSTTAPELTTSASTEETSTMSESGLEATSDPASETTSQPETQTESSTVSGSKHEMTAQERAECEKYFCIVGKLIRTTLETHPNNLVEVTGEGANATLILPHGLPFEIRKQIHFFTRGPDGAFKYYKGTEGNIGMELLSRRSHPVMVETQALNMLFQQSEPYDETPRKDEVPMEISGVFAFDPAPQFSDNFEFLISIRENRTFPNPDLLMILKVVSENTSHESTSETQTESANITITGTETEGGSESTSGTETEGETGSTSATETGDGSESTSGTETGDGNETTSETETQGESDSTSGTETEGEPGSTSATETGDGSESTSGTETGDGNETTSETETQGESDSTSGTETEGETGSTSATETGDGIESTSGTETGDGNETTSETETQGGSDSTSGTETEGGSESTSGTETEGEPGSTSATETGDGSESTSGTETGDGNETTSETETQGESDSTSGTETEGETGSTSATETGDGIESTSGTETGDGNETTSETETQGGSDSTSGTETEGGSESTSGTETEGETGSTSATETGDGSESTSGTETGDGNETTSETETQGESDSTSGTETEGETGSTSATETGDGNETTSETETQGGSDSTSGTETEGGSESTSGTETEGETGSTSATETGDGSESTSGTETGDGNETTSETETQGGSDSTSGTETEGGSESTSGTETEGGNESTSGTETGFGGITISETQSGAENETTSQTTTTDKALCSKHYCMSGLVTRIGLNTSDNEFYKVVGEGQNAVFSVLKGFDKAASYKRVLFEIWNDKPGEEPGFYYREKNPLCVTLPSYGSDPYPLHKIMITMLFSGYKGCSNESKEYQVPMEYSGMFSVHRPRPTTPFYMRMTIYQSKNFAALTMVVRVVPGNAENEFTSGTQTGSGDESTSGSQTEPLPYPEPSRDQVGKIPCHYYNWLRTFGWSNPNISNYYDWLLTNGCLVGWNYEIVPGNLPTTPSPAPQPGLLPVHAAMQDKEPRNPNCDYYQWLRESASANPTVREYYNWLLQEKCLAGISYAVTGPGSGRNNTENAKDPSESLIHQGTNPRCHYFNWLRNFGWSNPNNTDYYNWLLQNHCLVGGNYPFIPVNLLTTPAPQPQLQLVPVPGVIQGIAPVGQDCQYSAWIKQFGSSNPTVDDYYKWLVDNNCIAGAEYASLGVSSDQKASEIKKKYADVTARPVSAAVPVPADIGDKSPANPDCDYMSWLRQFGDSNPTISAYYDWQVANGCIPGASYAFGGTKSGGQSDGNSADAAGEGFTST